jgi:PIN domain nuclease of toxin-antitoxin system
MRTEPDQTTDPFGRMLIAQAKVEHLTLLTADEAVSAYGDFVSFVG